MTFQRGGDPKEMLNIGYTKRGLLLRKFLYYIQSDYLTYFIYELANDMIHRIDNEYSKYTIAEIYPDEKNLPDKEQVNFTDEEIRWITQELNKLIESIQKIAESELEISIKTEKEFDKAVIKAYTVRK